MGIRLGWTLVGSLLLAVAAWRNGEALPPPDELFPQLQEEPAQTAVSRPPFEATVGDITYTVRPLYRYDISGLVVSLHDSTAWWDWIHEAAYDRLNVEDLCVVFGDNVRSGAYSRIQFSSGEFECLFSSSSAADWQAFSLYAVSNNHLLTDRPELARAIRSVHIGDQVRIKGYLAEYTHHHGFNFFRGTSTTRTDTGNGACETIYVEEFEVLRRGGSAWRALAWLGVAAAMACVIAWFARPPVLSE